MNADPVSYRGSGTDTHPTMAVNNDAVLNVDVISDPDIMDISTDNGIEPYAASIAHGDVAGNGSVVGQKTIIAHFGRNTFHRFYQCHSF